MLQPLDAQVDPVRGEATRRPDRVIRDPGR
jgi:hypothetical protein